MTDSIVHFNNYESIRPYIIEECLHGSMLVCKFFLPPSKTVVISAVSFNGRRKLSIWLTQLRLLFCPWLADATIANEIKSAHRTDWENAVVKAFHQIQKID